MRGRATVLGLIGGALAGLAALGLYAALLPPLDLARVAERSSVVLDRSGKLLRPFVMVDGRWRMPLTRADVDPHYLDMLIAFEDKRFFSHFGIDPLALLRAGGQLITRGRIVSGGSTLTMQVARLIEPRSERSTLAKLRQIVRAIELERRLGKDDILKLYLSLAPFGGNLEGVRAASFAYFGKEPKRLSTAEAALLVALPQAPESRRPDRAMPQAIKARARVLDRLAARRFFTADEKQAASNEAIPSERRPFPHLAAHVAEAAITEAPAQRVHTLTLDARWQASLESLAREKANALGPKLSVAILVVDHASGDIRAAVGGADYFAQDRAGGMDLTRAVRSPGSALKPFIYAMAFDEGIAHPETMLEDRRHRFGLYAPENFDQSFHGMVSARQALQLSLNIPAVDLLSILGAQRFIARLRQSGAQILMPRDAVPNLAMALGGLGISLRDITQLYAGLARGGEIVPLRERGNAAAEPPAPGRSNQRIVDPVAAWYVSDILLGAPPPQNAPQNRLAYKTGTSYGYRDAWAVGYDRKHTIGIWVGRADNGAVPDLVGRQVAAPILFEAFARIGTESGPLPRPPGVLIATTASLPPPLRHVRQDIAKTFAAMATPSLRFAFPQDGSKIDLAASLIDGEKSVMIKIAGGVPPFTYLLNGAPLGASEPRRSTRFQPAGLGFVQLSVVDARGESSSVSVRLQ